MGGVAKAAEEAQLQDLEYQDESVTDTEEATTEEVTTEEAITEEAVTEETTTEEAATEETVTETKRNGWVKENQKWHYYNKGVLKNKTAGWYKIENKYYYLKADGSRVKKAKGFYNINNKWYYLYASGERVSKKAGWYKIENKYYYLKANGSRVEKAKGFYYINNKWYYLYASGKRISKKAGWYKISSKLYYIKSNGTHYSGWKTISGKKYYFGNKGSLTKGWIKVGKKRYYQTKEKGLYKNTVVKDSSDGKYYFVDSTGARIDNKLTKQLVKAYRTCTTESMTKEQKLYALYMYLATPSSINKNFTYERTYNDSNFIGKSGWTSDYAYQLLSRGKGNCYRFACCFGYFAKMLGYDSYVIVGQCPTLSGGWTPHCWVEIKINGTTYVCDPELQFAESVSDLYMKTYSTSPTRLRKGTTYKIKF